MAQYQTKLKTPDTQKANNTTSNKISFNKKNLVDQKQFSNADDSTLSDWANVQARMKLPGPTSKVQFSAKTQPVTNPKNIHRIAASGLSGSSQPLPYLNQIQKSFGSYDVGNVRAYVGARAAVANRTIGSEAYASQNKVAFAKKPSLYTAAHEATHIIQQRNGINLKNGIGQVDDHYEKEADKVASAVNKGGNVEKYLTRYSDNQMNSSANNIQMVINDRRQREDGKFVFFDSDYPEEEYYFAGELAEQSKDYPLFVLKEIIDEKIKNLPTDTLKNLIDIFRLSASKRTLDYAEVYLKAFEDNLRARENKNKGVKISGKTKEQQSETKSEESEGKLNRSDTNDRKKLLVTYIGQKIKEEYGEEEFSAIKVNNFFSSFKKIATLKDFAKLQEVSLFVLDFVENFQISFDQDDELDDDINDDDKVDQKIKILIDYFINKPYFLIENIITALLGIEDYNLDEKSSDRFRSPKAQGTLSISKNIRKNYGEPNVNEKGELEEEYSFDSDSVDYGIIKVPKGIKVKEAKKIDQPKKDLNKIWFLPNKFIYESDVIPSTKERKKFNPTSKELKKGKKYTDYPSLQELGIKYKPKEPTKQPIRTVKKMKYTSAAVRVPRGKGQASAMNGWSAYDYARCAKNTLTDEEANKIRQNVPYEWLHIQGAGLGGKTNYNNLLAGTAEANSLMIPLESRIKYWSARASAKQPLIVEFKGDNFNEAPNLGEQIELKVSAPKGIDAKEKDNHRYLQPITKEFTATFDTLQPKRNEQFIALSVKGPLQPQPGDEKKVPKRIDEKKESSISGSESENDNVKNRNVKRDKGKDKVKGYSRSTSEDESDKKDKRNKGKEKVDVEKESDEQSTEVELEVNNLEISSDEGENLSDAEDDDTDAFLEADKNGKFIIRKVQISSSPNSAIDPSDLHDSEVESQTTPLKGGTNSSPLKRYGKSTLRFTKPFSPKKSLIPRSKLNSNDSEEELNSNNSPRSLWKQLVEKISPNSRNKYVLFDSQEGPPFTTDEKEEKENDDDTFSLSSINNSKIVPSENKPSNNTVDDHSVEQEALEQKPKKKGKVILRKAKRRNDKYKVKYEKLNE